MAITYPRTDIISSVRYAGQVFVMNWRQELSTQSDGAVRGKDLGSALWAAEYTTVPLRADVGLTFEAKLNSLNGVVNAFEAGDLRRPYPLLYPTGSFTDSGQINTINANNKAVSFKGLPPGFVISVGDYFHFDYNGKRALHQVVESVTADGFGATNEAEIRPFLRPGLTVSTAVVFKNPRARFTLMPNGITPTLSPGFFMSVNFKAIQDVTASS